MKDTLVFLFGYERSRYERMFMFSENRVVIGVTQTQTRVAQGILCIIVDQGLMRGSVSCKAPDRVSFHPGAVIIGWQLPPVGNPLDVSADGPSGVSVQ